MIFYTVMVALAFVWLGGAFAFTDYFSWGFGLTAIGAGWLGIVFATQQRLLNNATRRDA